MKSERSEAWFARAQKSQIPGGVNSPVRAFRGVGGIPRISFPSAAKARASLDTDGNALHRLCGLLGTALLGPSSGPAVIDGLREVLEVGTSFGAPTEREVELAELIAKTVPSAWKWSGWSNSWVPKRP